MIKVIIADDELHIRVFLSKILVNAGFDVIGEASNGLEAIDMCTFDPPDLILLDLNMPVTPGDEIILSLKENFPHMIIIMITSAINLNLIEKCINLGVDNFIRKDTSIDDIITIIHNTISKKRRIDK